MFRFTVSEAGSSAHCFRQREHRCGGRGETNCSPYGAWEREKRKEEEKEGREGQTERGRHRGGRVRKREGGSKDKVGSSRTQPQ